jgi:hypothetical protein
MGGVTHHIAGPALLAGGVRRGDCHSGRGKSRFQLADAARIRRKALNNAPAISLATTRRSGDDHG